jgi:methionyl-tRNA formyltransferase
LEETEESRVIFLKRRIKRLGLVSTVGQVLFVALVVPWLRRTAKVRINEIVMDARLDLSWPPSSGRLIRVSSVNSQAAIDHITGLCPDIVVVNGTRIISKKVINLLNCPAINVHCGITPKYRGCNGGYWALANEDAGSSGVTIHLVDAGVDTGAVLGQEMIRPIRGDNFVTYPYLQLAAALPGLLDQIQRALENRLHAFAGQGDSKQWYHPTLWGYVWTGLSRGIW